MKVLLTGANGYLGGYVKDELTKNHIEYESISYKDLQAWDLERIAAFLINSGISDVIHLAAAVGEREAGELYESNIMMLYTLLCASREAKVRNFVFASGNNVYSCKRDKGALEEEACEPESKNQYGVSKYVGECLIENYCKSWDMGYAIVRIADIYGPKQKTGNLMKALVGNAASGKSLKLYGEGVRKRDYIYVTDVAKGMVHICQNRIQGKINLGTGIATSVKELVLIAKECSDNRCDIEKIAVDKEDTSSIYLNIDKLEDSGFHPEVLIQQGIKMCIEEEKKWMN